MEVSVQSKPTVPVSDAGGLLPVFFGQLEYGKILSQDMVSSVHIYTVPVMR